MDMYGFGLLLKRDLSHASISSNQNGMMANDVCCMEVFLNADQTGVRIVRDV